MAFEFKLPHIGEGLTEGEVTKWLVKEGQSVAEDQPMVEVLTDKATVEITAPRPGVIEKILVPDGTKVPVGTVIVVIGDGAGARGGQGGAGGGGKAQEAPRGAPREGAPREGAPREDARREPAPRQPAAAAATSVP